MILQYVYTVYFFFTFPIFQRDSPVPTKSERHCILFYLSLSSVMRLELLIFYLINDSSNDSVFGQLKSLGKNLNFCTQRFQIDVQNN